MLLYLVFICYLVAKILKKICQYSFTNNLPITARGAGTGLLGQYLIV